MTPRSPTSDLPRKLFGPVPAVGGRNYAVSSDGKRFLMYTLPSLRTNVPITLIQNWQPGLTIDR